MSFLFIDEPRKMLEKVRSNPKIDEIFYEKEDDKDKEEEEEKKFEKKELGTVLDEYKKYRLKNNIPDN